MKAMSKEKILKLIFKINKYNYKTKIIIKICKLTRNNQMFGLRIFSKQNLKILNLKLNKIIFLL